MSTRTTIIISLAIIAIAAALSVAAYGRLPERVASHWNAADQVDGTVPRLWGVILMPLITLGMLGLFLLLPDIDPMRANIARFRPVFNAFIALMMFFMLYMHALTLVWNLGWQGFRMSSALLPAMGLLFVFIGVMLRGAKRNFSIGIRTPWTLASDHVWEATHRLGAVLFVAAGALTLLGAFFPPVAYLFVLIPVLASTLFLVVYSYFLWRAEQSGNT